MMGSLAITPMVTFLDIKDHYSLIGDLTCCFKLGDTYIFNETNDFVAIFKLGWNSSIEYVLRKAIKYDSQSRIGTVTFLCNELPTDTTILYQICYISGQELQGASSPFEFCSGDRQLVSSEIFSSKVLTSCDSSAMCQVMAEKDDEIIRLREMNASLKQENKVLKRSLELLVHNQTKSIEKDYSREITELRDLVEGLHIMTSAHDKDIAMLKKKIIEGGEEYKKLYLEKYKIEKKYEKLKKTCDKKTLCEEDAGSVNVNKDLGELEALPPFPSIINH